VLAELLAELSSEGVDLTRLGFADADLDQILAGFAPAADPDEAPPLPEGEPVSKPGEIYQLRGGHRVACGDCRDRELMAELMEGRQADLYWSDPPWGVGYVGKTQAALRIENDDDVAAGLLELLTEGFTVAGELLAPAAPFYVAAPSGPRGTEFRLALRAAGWRHRQTLTWVKNAPTLGRSHYQHRCESILFGVTAADRPGGGGSRWYGGRDQADVFFVDRPVQSAQHPTMKPVALVAAMLRNSSRRGEVVLDPFLGAGATLLAAEQLGRVCYGAELDPRYVDVVRRRFEEFGRAA